MREGLYRVHGPAKMTAPPPPLSLSPPPQPQHRPSPSPAAAPRRYVPIIFVMYRLLRFCAGVPHLTLARAAPEFRRPGHGRRRLCLRGLQYRWVPSSRRGLRCLILSCLGHCTFSWLPFLYFTVRYCTDVWCWRGGQAQALRVQLQELVTCRATGSEHILKSGICIACAKSTAQLQADWESQVTSRCHCLSGNAW